MAASRFVVVAEERSWRRTDEKAGDGDEKSVLQDRLAKGGAREFSNSGSVRQIPATDGDFVSSGASGNSASGLDSRFHNLSSLQRRKQRTQERAKQGKDSGADGGVSLAEMSPADWSCTLDVKQRLALHADFMRLLEEVDILHT
jgi:hypothetical protein